MKIGGYVIMPDHIHMILIFSDNENGRMISAPTSASATFKFESGVFLLIISLVKFDVNKNVEMYEDDKRKEQNLGVLLQRYFS